MKQIIFKDLEEGTTQAGFLMDDGTVVCGCCGEEYTGSEKGIKYEILKTSEYWADIQVAILVDNQELYNYVETTNKGE